ncbi:uncharacterized protein BDZ99DRAFT_568174 [Mytilinidion resinicola]|uniref:Uncharacterized protein n=1 Tax=Mytilinidion resinicola TaxID=574789 RepID=A0A6A6YV97_9PEZI|nr:uncharacterized protein BDZ99DRAFT_568174 [Mytilinidion resinicola]KAF2812862.1 hypothetical protein BDZ99DRAFT_568174 [Mytilinidion resinicola]
MAPPLCNARNIVTGAAANRCHHCGYCKKKISSRCFKRLHLANCTETHPATGRECGERFLVRSKGGCMRKGHSYRDGANKAIQMQFREMYLGMAPWDDDLPEDNEGLAKNDADDDSEDSGKLEVIVEEEETEDGVLLTFSQGRSPFEKWDKKPATPKDTEKESTPPKDNSGRKSRRQALAVTAQDFIKRKK